MLRRLKKMGEMLGKDFDVATKSDIDPLFEPSYEVVKRALWNVQFSLAAKAFLAFDHLRECFFELLPAYQHSGCVWCAGLIYVWDVGTIEDNHHKTVFPIFAQASGSIFICPLLLASNGPKRVGFDFRVS